MPHHYIEGGHVEEVEARGGQGHRKERSLQVEEEEWGQNEVMEGG